jgi:hypothetical protein
MAGLVAPLVVFDLVCLSRLRAKWSPVRIKKPRHAIKFALRLCCHQTRSGSHANGD